MVGAIHGRLLTAWATAGVLGPVIVNYMRDYQLSLGIAREQVYNQTMYILAGLLIVGLILNLSIRPLASKWFMTDEELAEEKRLAHERVEISQPISASVAIDRGPSYVKAVLPWLAVGLPLLWGVSVTLQKALILFR
jgi:hypothetical protein